MFPESFNKYKKALLIGTGGGNDIVSTIIPALHLQKLGISTDIAGILSPAAVHLFDGKKEQVVNKVNTDIIRHLCTPDGDVDLSFIDSKLTDILKSENINIPNIYDFSIRFGTQPLVDSVKKLIKDNDYDLIVAVDVGGDILGRSIDTTLLSPMMDFTVLYLMGQLDTDSFLIEFGLGTDGELRVHGMDDIIQEFTDSNMILHETTLNKNDAEIIKFKSIFKSISEVRAGHTATMTLQTLEDSSMRDITSEYRYRTQIGKNKWFISFDIILPKKYAGKTYLIDVKKLYSNRMTTAFAYENSLEQYIKLKNICPQWKTEFDLFYIFDSDNWTTTESGGNSLMLLMPSLNIPKNPREYIIYTGLKETKSDMVLLYKDNNIVISDAWSIKDIGNFRLLSKIDNDLEKNIDEYIKE